MFSSTTRPGHTRGEHFHLRKIERFVVLAGTGEIALRRLFDDQVVTFNVSGTEPAIVDMPTMWAHAITNTGSADLTTLFWADELFDPDRSDTYPEKVVLGEGAPVKVLTVVGTRPELIRLSRVIARLDDEVEHRLVHTGQNWDPQLRDVFFTELGLRAPDHWLDVPVTSLGATLGGVLTAIEPVLLAERPDAFLVLGDTNSCLAAIMAKRLGIPVFHMEAGNRCFDENVPEETNRRIIDHTADFNLCYTEHARRNLLAEGLPARRIFVTGSPLAEVLDRLRRPHRRLRRPRPARTRDRRLLPRLDAPRGERRRPGPARRAHSQRSGRWPATPAGASSSRRTRDCGSVLTEQPNRASSTANPFGYLDYNKLQRSARCVLSDSGTVSEEAALTPFPAVTIRDSMERPEALDTGTIVLTGVDADGIRRAVELVCAQWDAGARPAVPAGYEVRDCSLRVSRLITGLVGVHAQWLGLRPKRWS